MIYDKSRFCYRLFWRFVFLASCAGSVILMVNIVSKLINPGLSTSVDVELSPENGLPFPSFTICNLNQHKRSYVDANPEFQYLLLSWYGYFKPFFFNDVEESEIVSQMDVDLKQLDIEQMMRDAAPTLKETIYEASWAGYDEINVSAAFEQVMTNQGVCYTYKGDPQTPLFQIVAGKNRGMSMTIMTKTDDYCFNGISDGAEGIQVCLIYYKPILVSRVKQL